MQRHKVTRYCWEKVVLIDLLNAGLPQIFNLFWKKMLLSLQATGKLGLLINTRTGQTGNPGRNQEVKTPGFQGDVRRTRLCRGKVLSWGEGRVRAGSDGVMTEASGIGPEDEIGLELGLSNFCKEPVMVNFKH